MGQSPSTRRVASHQSDVREPTDSLLLPAAEALGMDLTESFQLMPEQSTAAIVVHHPEAKYYAVRGAADAPAGEPETAGV